MAKTRLAASLRESRTGTDARLRPPRSARTTTRRTSVCLNLERAVQVCVRHRGPHRVRHRIDCARDDGGKLRRARERGAHHRRMLAGRMRRAVGFRNISVHAYQTLDWDIVYAIATERLPLRLRLELRSRSGASALRSTRTAIVPPGPPGSRHAPGAGPTSTPEPVDALAQGAGPTSCALGTGGCQSAAGRRPNRPCSTGVEPRRAAALLTLEALDRAAAGSQPRRVARCKRTWFVGGSNAPAASTMCAGHAAGRRRDLSSWTPTWDSRATSRRRRRVSGGVRWRARSVPPR